MKIGYGLVAALAAAYSAVAIAPMQAQGLKPVKTVKPAVTVDGGTMSEIVGAVDDRKFTFGEVIARAQKDNINVFNQTVGQVIGLDAASSLFGPTAKGSYSVTKPQAMALLRKKSPPLLGGALKTMIETELIDREAKKQGITVSNEQVDKRIDQLLKMLHNQGRIPSGVTDTQFLAQNHYTRETLRQSLLPQTRLFNLIQHDFVEKRLGHKLTADDFFKVRHILVAVPMAMPGQSAADIKKVDDAALAKITQIAADLETKKKTFEQAVKESSEDEASKAMGGDLGVQMRTVFVKEFETAAYALKPNEISKPIRSQFGYHLIQLQQRGAEIPEDTRQQYLDNFESGQVQIYLRQLMTTHKVDNKLAVPTPGMPMMPGQ